VVRPPRDKEKRYPELVLTEIYAREKSKPKGQGEDRLEGAHRPARSLLL
jgi:hypothetical protein